MRHLLASSALLFIGAFGCASPPVTEGSGSTSSRQLAGRIVGEDELATALRNAGFDEDTVPKMICTAKYESSFHEEATNSNSNGTTDYGIFQINSIHVGKTSGCPSTTDELLSLDANTQCAFGVFSVQGLNAWVAYKSHQAECDAATAPAGDPNTTDPNADPNTNPNNDPNTDPNTQTDGGADSGTPDCWNDPSAPGCDDGNGGNDPCWNDPYAPGCYDDGYGDDGWAKARPSKK